MKILYGEGFTEAELQTYRVDIINNLVEGVVGREVCRWTGRGASWREWLPSASPTPAGPPWRPWPGT
jgi:hypothetical protein